MNRGTIMNKARDYLASLSTTYVTATTLANAVNDSMSRFNSDAEFYRTDATLSIKAGGREFTIPTAITKVYQVRLSTGTDRVALEPTHRDKLTREDTGWEGGTAGTPSHYYCDGGYIGFDPKPRALSHWTKSHAYAVGDRAIPSATDNGFIYDCTTAGTSGTTEPTWATTIDGTVGDVQGGAGTVVWQQSGSTRVYIRALTEPSELGTSTAVPTWLPNRYHRTLPKAAALEILGGFDSENQAADRRIAMLYKDYTNDVRELRNLANGRSAEYSGRICPRFKD